MVKTYKKINETESECTETITTIIKTEDIRDEITKLETYLKKMKETMKEMEATL